MRIARPASPRHTTTRMRVSSPLTRARVRKSAHSYRRELRAEMIEAYGGQCECPPCGIAVVEFLTLEHKRKDGAEHRRRVGQNAQAQLLDLKRRGWPTEDFGLLCFNCNLGSALGECPHVSIERELLKEHG